MHKTIFDRAVQNSFRFDFFPLHIPGGGASVRRHNIPGSVSFLRGAFALHAVVTLVPSFIAMTSGISLRMGNSRTPGRVPIGVLILGTGSRAIRSVDGFTSWAPAIPQNMPSLRMP